jgi:hypothetical protein
MVQLVSLHLRVSIRTQTKLRLHPHGRTFPIRVDIIEEIISEEIVDETDRYEDNRHKRRAKRQSTAAIMRG